ncbi:Probable DNA endonuclease SmrA [Serratia plymuthica]|nr:Probable DNA endonuclease SmrA [Serratia plymuthica]
MSNQEKDVFAQAMADVIPLSRGCQTLYLKPQERVDKRARREAQALRQENFLSTGFLEVIPCGLPLEYKGEGIQQGVLDKLRNGRYPPQANLSLLRQPVETCRQELFRFILLAEKHNLRSLLIVHGRGARTRATQILCAATSPNGWRSLNRCRHFVGRCRATGEKALATSRCVNRRRPRPTTLSVMPSVVARE